MREITWSAKDALNVFLQSFSSTSTYRIKLQKLSIWSHLRPFSATCVLHMRRNGYLCSSGVNLDNAVRFTDPDFLLECKISAIWRLFRWFLRFICWMSAIFLLPVCFTYWPRKYTTRVDPHVDNSHQVWSWYDHTLPSYSVFVRWYVSWPCDLDLWSFDLKQLQCSGSRGGQKQLHIWNPRPRFAYSLYHFGGSTMNIIKVICENNARTVLKKRMRFCACAKSRDLFKLA